MNKIDRLDLSLYTVRVEMETDLELNAKRLEVKNEITEGINKTPMARLFNVTGSIVQKITRYPKQLPLAYSVAVLSLNKSRKVIR